MCSGSQNICCKSFVLHTEKSFVLHTEKSCIRKNQFSFGYQQNGSSSLFRFCGCLFIYMVKTFLRLYRGYSKL